MSSTVTRDDKMLDPASAPYATRPMAPAKLRRRPALVAAAIVAICLGALIAGWAWTATTNTHEVLVARHSIERGSVIEARDLARVRVSADPALKPVPADEFDRVVGQRAVLDIARGGMLTPESFSSTVIPAAGEAIVGVALTPAQAPGVTLQSGDEVRVIVTPAEGEESTPGVPPFSEAEVVGVHVTGESGQIIVDLLVPRADAAVLAARVATGDVAIVLDSRER